MVFGNGYWQRPGLAGLIAASALAFSVGALARDEAEPCDAGIYDAIGRDLRIKDFAGWAQDKDSWFIVAQACKTWPYKPDLMLVALAYDMGVEYEKELVVAVIDKEKKRVVSSYQRTIQEDAVTEVGTDSLGLDTARYQFAQGVRAFGVRFDSSARGASCPDNKWNGQLTLMLPKGKSLHPVMSLYKHWQRGGFCSESDDFDFAQLTIGVENTHSHGFYDLRVTANITTFAEGGKNEHTKPREHVIFRYDGNRYEPSGIVPWWLSIWGNPPGE
jgi:hypothetical protein